MHTEPTWQWRCSDEAGVATDGPDEVFDSQESAEAWLTENFEDLADAGIAAVTLFDGEHVIYGPMSLAPES